MFGALFRPEILPALFGLGGVVVGSVVSGSVQIWLLGKRIRADEVLAQRKYTFDADLAQRRFDYDRQQAIFKRRFELAEQFLADAYRISSIIEFSRQGTAFGNEGESRKADGMEPEHIKRQRDIYFVPFERLNYENEFISSMFSRRAACRTHFGPKAEEAFELFNDAIHRVRVASALLVKWTTEKDSADSETMEALLSDIWEPMAVMKNTNEVGAKVERAVSLVEEICQPVLSWTDRA